MVAICIQEKNFRTFAVTQRRRVATAHAPSKAPHLYEQGPGCPSLIRSKGVPGVGCHLGIPLAGVGSDTLESACTHDYPYLLHLDYLLLMVILYHSGGALSTPPPNFFYFFLLQPKQHALARGERFDEGSSFLVDGRRVRLEDDTPVRT